MLTPTTLRDVRLAVATEIGTRNVPTGIVKRTTTEQVRINSTGIVGDMQADKRVHGGAEKAVYHFPAERYELLQTALPHLANTLTELGMGENFSTYGLSDERVHIGDVFAIGSAVLQVSQPRMPCWKLNQHIGNAYIGRLLMTHSAAGWYYRVLQEGTTKIGDAVTHIERAEGSVSVAAVWHTWLAHNKKPFEHPLPTVPHLSEEWLRAW